MYIYKQQYCAKHVSYNLRSLCAWPSVAETGHGIGDDWQEEVYQKVKYFTFHDPEITQQARVDTGFDRIYDNKCRSKVSKNEEETCSYGQKDRFYLTFRCNFSRF